MICLATLLVLAPAPGDVVQSHYLKATNTDAGDLFGSSVAIDGDTMVVGAPEEWSSAAGVDGDQNGNGRPYSGAAYVYVRNGADWELQGYLKATNPGYKDYFGSAVAISGDLVAVSALGEDSEATGVDGNQAGSGAEDSGAVYVYRRTGTTWAADGYVKASNTDPFDRFGATLSISGDTLVVGATGEDGSSSGIDGDQGGYNEIYGTGAAYVFVRGSGGWAQQAYIKASNAEFNENFACSLDLHGDTLVVGNITEDSGSDTIDQGQEDNSANATGAAYVFQRSGTTWSQQAYLKPWTAQFSGDSFGGSVSVHGDVIAVGATGDDSSAVGVDGAPSSFDVNGSGAVYLFRRSGASWAPAHYLKASVPNGSTGFFNYGDEFGYTTDLTDGALVVAARYEGSASTGVDGDEADDSLEPVGAAYLFVEQGATWVQRAFVKGSATDLWDGFNRVAISESTFVVGAGGEDGSGTGTNGVDTDNSAAESGAAFVFEFAPNDEPLGTPICSGDGSGGVCPCAPGVAGGGCAGAGTAGAVLSAVGTPELFAEDVEFLVSGLAPNRPGLCIKGSTLLGGGLGIPLGNGLLCTSSQLRSQVVVSSASGDVQLSSWQGGLFSAPPVANFGVPTIYQWWFRDPGAACSGAGFNLTNAYSVSWQ